MSIEKLEKNIESIKQEHEKQIKILEEINSLTEESAMIIKDIKERRQKKTCYKK
ncbi:hypothetical protein [Salinicoccus halitifaciens]|uniref:Archaellum component FlaC n=1 Tax=Salinicoccus halitifaciens TaxID=1073415 RepID=A0ABV2E5R0_9STAP|nr:hypothetical protein [Salinicoccus halitifaciens]MCD2137193.1 hypothetical protein [Salinicoccus halitifaciens]